jgi:flagellar assembly protein FliH
VAEIRPYDLGSFDEEVAVREELVRAREAVRAAEADRARIVEEARKEGLELGRREAVELAVRQEGERLAREAAPLGAVLQKAVEGVEACRRDLLAAAERDLLKLALAVAAKVVKAELRAGGAIAPANLGRALELCAKRQELRVFVHPEDLALVEAYLPDLRRRFADLGTVAVEGLESIGRGGAVVQTREGTVDASIEVQLAEIERGLLG